MRISPLLLALALGVAGSAARAGTVTVTTTGDGGAGSLRDAVTNASADDHIVFDASLAGSTITLTSGELDPKPNTTMTIDGEDKRITISGNKAYRVFHVVTTGSQIVTIKSLTIRDGSHATLGAGILNDGVLSLEDVTITECATAGNGGGIANNTGAVTAQRCTISGNNAVNGGGIYEDAGTVSLTNCTISGNVATSGGGFKTGSVNPNAYLGFCTVADNLASGTGGGIDGSSVSQSVALESTILSGNAAPTGPDCAGTLSTFNHNLVRSVSGCTFVGTDTGSVKGQDAKLGSLQFNGGLTRTHALLRGSPAIDLVPTISCMEFGGDQRTLSRPQDGDGDAVSTCDAGAYEAARSLVVTSLADPGDGGTCTLRQAVQAANTNAVAGTCAAGYLLSSSPDRIVFDVTGTITLGSPLVVSDSVMIEGPGADRLTVSGGGTTRIFDISSGTGANTYVISGLTLANAQSDYGGAVRLFFASDDTLSIDRTYFKDDVGTGNGGSIYTQGSRLVEVDRSTFVNTRAAGANASLAFLGGHAELRNATVGETSSSVSGVAVDGSVGAASLRLLSCTIRGSEPFGVLSNSATTTYGATIMGGGHSAANFAGSTFVSEGDNVISDSSGAAAASGDLKSTDPMLGPLSYNGGPIPTFGTKVGSPAIGHVPQSAHVRTRDGRGIPRHAVNADTGALEHVPSGDADGNGTLDVADVFYLINYLFAGGPPPVNEGDVNGDGVTDIADVFYLVNTLFASGPAPV
jgi:CSLREA domain-containing protein